MQGSLITSSLIRESYKMNPLMKVTDMIKMRNL
ncbi:hypothetical protein OIU77_000013 [Salix suchowensis]|uniref:Uncharacterized protein n=1 Tax=Salix suchowensis TaxID=1278906 RepID=A0ABQ9B716_9ROSI|nr:hypothetical protein OIU77_000013 [Salix suchowensis]